MILRRSVGAASLFSFVGRIKIWRERFKLGAAGVDAFVNRNDAEALSISRELRLPIFSVR